MEQNKHKKTIEKYNGSLKELSRDIRNLDYDALTELFGEMKNDAENDSTHDLKLNHPQVAEHLRNISKALQEILDKDMQPIAKLCRPYNEKGIR